MHPYLDPFYAAFPAFIANMAPVFVAKAGWLHALDVPLDFRKTIFGKRIFGDHKTIRGLIAGILMGGAMGIVQYALHTFGIVKYPYLLSDAEFILFGFFGGMGALIGDAVESFFKRQFNIASGRPFIPFDQTDYIVGFLLFTLPFVSWSFHEVIFLLCVGIICNPLSNILAYVLRIKDTYW